MSQQNYDEVSIREKLFQIRTGRGFTKRRMAELMNMNEASYARIENGTIGLSYEHLTKFASVMGMSVVDVLNFSEEQAARAPSKYFGGQASQLVYIENLGGISSKLDKIIQLLSKDAEV